MKKRLLLLSVLTLFMHAASWAYDFSAKNDDGVTIYYNKSGSEATVTYKSTSYNSYSGEVVIPETVIYDGNTYTVTSIGDHAFAGSSGLTEVIIPNSVSEIGESAFDDCKVLTEVTIPNSVTTISSYAFASCSGLMGELSIPDNVTSIGERAFYKCSGLTSVTLGNSVTEIKSQAFVNCSSLTYVNINNCVAEIGSLIFLGCTNLEKFEVAESNQTYNTGDGVLFSKDMTTLIIFPLASPLLPSYDIPNSVTTIESYAFYNCTGLTSVTVPSSVTTIGEGALAYCTRLSEFKVSEDNLYFCEQDGVLFSKDMTMLVSFPLLSPLLPSYDIPNSVTTIESYAFYNCTGLTSVTVPSSVTEIGSDAFEGCSGLTEVTIGDGVILIKEWAFYSCTGLTSLTLGNSVTEIGYSAFGYCRGLTELNIPNSVMEIGDNAFTNCRGLNQVKIGEGVIKIYDEAFEGCSGLTEIYSLNPEPPTCKGNSVFYGVNKKVCVLYVPEGTLQAYSTAYAWEDFFNIVDNQPNGIADIATNGNAEATGYYTTDGKLLGAQQRGINIIRYSDGTTKKVLVK